MWAEKKPVKKSDNLWMKTQSLSPAVSYAARMSVSVGRRPPTRRSIILEESLEDGLVLGGRRLADRAYLGQACERVVAEHRHRKKFGDEQLN